MFLGLEFGSAVPALVMPETANPGSGIAGGELPINGLDTLARLSLTTKALPECRVSESIYAVSSGIAIGQRQLPSTSGIHMRGKT